MTQGEHPRHDLLVRALDDELLPEEAAAADRHLSQCEACKREYEALRALSVRLGAVVGSIGGEAGEGARDSLRAALDAREQSPAAPRRPRKLLRNFGLGVALAAGLILAALLVPWTSRLGETSRPHAVVEEANGAIEIDGETFIALPYSNPDLPMSAAHIVEMQVPVASLADAGISFEPISAVAANDGGSVLADVLIGLDGQPLGVHVLSAP
ncbi:MAG: anti-sigma factor family protein [Bryobacteraceae bacterium]